MQFVDELRAVCGCEVFVVELPFVAQRCVTDVPSEADFVRAIDEMLRSRGHERAVFVGHSLGSAFMGMVARTRPELYAGAVFIDPVRAAARAGVARAASLARCAAPHRPQPSLRLYYDEQVCFLMHHPGITREMVFREWSGLSEYAEEFLVRSELFTAHYLQRHMHWRAHARALAHTTGALALAGAV